MIHMEGVRKTYPQGGRQVVALDRTDLTVAEGEFLSVMGPSGSGKSTLLHLAGGMDLPSEGRVLIDGTSTSEMDERALTLLRRRRVGFVFQFFNLLPTLTVEENIALPRLIDGARMATIADEVTALIERVGLTERRGHHPSELSGGEMQRVAIARALIIDPEIVLADEPTGNLDSVTGKEVLSLLRDLAHGDSRARTVVMVTHDRAAAEVGDRVVQIIDGKIGA